MGREWWWVLGAYSPELSTAALYVWSGVTFVESSLERGLESTGVVGAKPDESHSVCLLLFVMPTPHWDPSLFVSLQDRRPVRNKLLEGLKPERAATRGASELAQVRAPLCWTGATVGPSGHSSHRNRNRKQEGKS
ncbi:hypothetical protein THAOC_14503 [Thalassiosira oceanica]|uniref:Uncharacterized protein n=1 Tax=Thalassiosira oceanica TaxID=159749 RepID=K0SF69_THAOC|nr:hypothetical protein THAOC_14503 [Thalassiosira oceanica]|eukprot:EJK64733.1 hypothetical protein THAOC_14503 [Thalassiosira oceanica]